VNPTARAKARSRDSAPSSSIADVTPAIGGARSAQREARAIVITG
jgi:hypothetical protein